MIFYSGPWNETSSFGLYQEVPVVDLWKNQHTCYCILERCYKEAAEADVPILCAFNRRFDPGVSTVRSKIKEGVIGQLQVIKTTSRDHPLPKMEFLSKSGGIGLPAGLANW